MSTLYVLRAKGTDIYKIGATRGAVPDRIKQLRVGCPFPLEVVCTHDAEDAFGLERGFHHYFHDKRLEGEWFRLSEVDVETIRRDCEEPPVPLPDEADEEDQERGGAETLAQRYAQPRVLYLALPFFAVIGFVALDSSVGVVAREHLSNLWFIAFVVSLSLLVDSYRRRARERHDHRLIHRLAGGVSLFYMKEIVANPKGAAAIITKSDRQRARRLLRRRLRGKMELYQCLALLINSVEAADLNDHSARMRLYRLFKSRNWDWPDGDDPIEVWRKHFEEHPLG